MMTEDSNANVQQPEGGVEVETTNDYSQFETVPSKEQPKSEPVVEDQPQVEESETQPSTEVSDDFESKYKDLQAEFTRKSQKLSELEKKLEASQEDGGEELTASEDEQIVELKKLLKEAGAVFQDEIQEKEYQQKRMSELDKFASENPQYAKYKNVLAKIGQHDAKSWEQIAIEEFGDIIEDKPSNKPVMGAVASKERTEEAPSLDGIKSIDELKQRLNNMGYKSNNLYK